MAKTTTGENFFSKCLLMFIMHGIIRSVFFDMLFNSSLIQTLFRKQKKTHLQILDWES